MNQIKICEPLLQKLPNIKLGGFICNVDVSPTSKDLENHINNTIVTIAEGITPETIRNMSTVKVNKDAYRKLGKDPNRYRPASESLLRRIASGKGLYSINNVVDILNLISVTTGYSICGYDYDTISGEISMGIGMADEPYEGIGRGKLNIESLPVFRDEKGAFGTPTSDSVRTQVTETTKRFMMIIIGFDEHENINNALDKTIKLLAKYANGSVIDRFLIERQ